LCKIVGSNFCQLDSIIIHDGANAGAPVLMRVCGQQSILRLSSTGNQMFIMFTSDSSELNKGFEASFEQGELT